ncbi:hypothetical protein OWR29_25555 [Actinoplanes sp. Pm04-4]|uniref:Uncharacterized protein n=1 Tax=Paractinoplanes pyxinae TaxID=2997416 RepID=A0ABT4B4F9_9ACTN|nr:hypothetical protein [Actinoplanes pyxinae]MCY1141379.1 hypothetical protein [Actinoplanes pyxinae]
MTWEQFIASAIPQPRTIQVQALTGSGAYGDVYADPVDVALCVVDDTNRVVPVQTQDTEGSTAVSSTTVFCPKGTAAPVGSLVTLPNGRVAKVIARSDLDDHGLGLPEHVELDLE